MWRLLQIKGLFSEYQDQGCTITCVLFVRALYFIMVQMWLSQVALGSLEEGGI